MQAEAAPAAAPVDKTCGTPSVPGGGNCMTSLISSAFETIRLMRGAANSNKLDNAEFTQNTASKLSRQSARRDHDRTQTPEGSVGRNRGPVREGLCGGGGGRLDHGGTREAGGGDACPPPQGEAQEAAWEHPKSDPGAIARRCGELEHGDVRAGRLMAGIITEWTAIQGIS
ncbi:hypothetical protein ATKI12_4322 [Kitasatospora sp. Ki12]